jgi:hypothetical protein
MGPNKPDTEDYEVSYRLVADEGKKITDGILVTKSKNTKNPEAWSEIDDTDTPKEDFKFPTLDDYR